MANVSHGRGGTSDSPTIEPRSSHVSLIGAANIAPDTTPYTDGAIVREGPVGNQGDGPYSAGRGGVGNIDKDGKPSIAPHDDEVIPETSVRLSKEESRHVGRGGAGNEFHAHADPDKQKVTPEDKPEGGKLGDKIKGIFQKK